MAVAVRVAGKVEVVVGGREGGMAAAGVVEAGGVVEGEEMVVAVARAVAREEELEVVVMVEEVMGAGDCSHHLVLAAVVEAVELMAVAVLVAEKVEMMVALREDTMAAAGLVEQVGLVDVEGQVVDLVEDMMVAVARAVAREEELEVVVMVGEVRVSVAMVAG
jgi:hypothetical protein